MHQSRALPHNGEVIFVAAITFSMKAPASILKDRGIGAGDKVQMLIDKEVLARCEPYVPKKTGALIASGRAATVIGSGNITYSAVYAAYQYYGRTAAGNAIKYNGAPMRGSYWFERMKSAHASAILAKAAALAGGIPAAAKESAHIPIPLNQPVKTVIGQRKTPVFIR